MIYSGLALEMSDNKGISHKVKQVNVVSARNAYNSGKTVWLHPSSLRLKNVWQEPYPYKLSETNTENFDSLITCYYYYNCNCGRGRRILYFIEI